MCREKGSGGNSSLVIGVKWELAVAETTLQHLVCVFWFFFQRNSGHLCS